MKTVIPAQAGIKRWILAFARMTLSVCLVFYVAGCMPSSSRGSAATGNEINGGQIFTLKDLSGANLSLEKLLTEKKAVLLNFWASWCPPCREEIPDLAKLEEKYKDRSFTVLGVSVNDSRARAAAFVPKSGINYPIVVDEDGSVAEQYGIVGIPTSVLVSADKKIIGVYYGFTRQLEEDVEKILSRV